MVDVTFHVTNVPFNVDIAHKVLTEKEVDNLLKLMKAVDTVTMKYEKTYTVNSTDLVLGAGMEIIGVDVYLSEIGGNDDGSGEG